MCMKTKELGWKENHVIQTTNVEDSQGNIKGRSETSTKNLGELYYKALQSS